MCTILYVGACKLTLKYCSNFFWGANSYFYFQQAVDIFTASLPSLENRLFAMGKIAKNLTLPVPGRENLYPLSKPVVQVNIALQ